MANVSIRISYMLFSKPILQFSNLITLVDLVVVDVNSKYLTTFYLLK